MRLLDEDAPVRDAEVLPLGGAAPDRGGELARVDAVERRVDLVEHEEGRRVHLLQREQEGERRERLLAARERLEAARLLTARPGDEGEAALEGALGVAELEPALAARELVEVRLEGLGHGLEGLEERGLLRPLEL